MNDLDEILCNNFLLYILMTLKYLKQLIVSMIAITISHLRSDSTHIDTIVREANRTLSFIFRTCKKFKNIIAIKSLFYSFVRSKFIYTYAQNL